MPCICQVLVCRLVDGKITYVHRRVWPALVRLARELRRDRLAEIREVHTPLGKHVVKVRSFPDWVPAPVQRAAARLTDDEARVDLGSWWDTRNSGKRRIG
jgi:hypothetical protein